MDFDLRVHEMERIHEELARLARRVRRAKGIGKGVADHLDRSAEEIRRSIADVIAGQLEVDWMDQAVPKPEEDVFSDTKP